MVACCTRSRVNASLVWDLVGGNLASGMTFTIWTNKQRFEGTITLWVDIILLCSNMTAKNFNKGFLVYPEVTLLNPIVDSIVILRVNNSPTDFSLVKEPSGQKSTWHFPHNLKLTSDRPSTPNRATNRARKSILKTQRNQPISGPRPRQYYARDRSQRSFAPFPSRLIVERDGDGSEKEDFWE